MVARVHNTSPWKDKERKFQVRGPKAELTLSERMKRKREREKEEREKRGRKPSMNGKNLAR